MTTTFSPQLLNNFEGLQDYLSGRRDLFLLNGLSKEDVKLPEGGQLYFGRWHVAWIVITYPLVLITSVALEVLSYALSICFLRSLSKRVDVLSHYVHMKASNWATQFMWGKSLLVPTPNRHQAGTSDVYTQSPVLRENILSKEIRDELVKDIEYVDFYKHVGRTYSNGRHIEAGLCQGMVYWFNTQFLRAYNSTNLKDKAESFAEYASAIAKKFEYGATKEAAVLQALPGVESELLKLHMTQPLTFTQTELETSPASVKKKIEEMPDGIYFLGLHTHGMSYINFNGEKLLFNPGEGLFKLDGVDGLLSHIRPHLHGHDKAIYFNHHLLKPELVSSQEDVDEPTG